MNPGILQSLANAASRNYTLSIVNRKAPPALTLLELVVVVEMLLASGRGSNPGVVQGSPFGGMDGGFGGFKL